MSFGQASNQTLNNTKKAPVDKSEFLTVGVLKISILCIERVLCVGNFLRNIVRTISAEMQIKYMPTENRFNGYEKVLSKKSDEHKPGSKAKNGNHVS